MKNTPRDFFLHFGAFAALYSAAIALATLLFRMIDYAFPDALRENYYYGYSDPYSGPMRFAIASLIILVPIFLYLFRIIQREAREAPERYTLAIRKWLTYITLFVAGATIIGDLIALLNSFLGGVLVTTFLLKVLTLLAITGAAFWYFLLDIRGHWQSREAASKNIGLGVLGLVITVIIGGFLVMGSPMQQREIQFDQQQVQDLSLIQNEIVGYWQQNGRLPATLAEIESPLTGFSVPVAPEGREPYEYRTTGGLTFELCATFVRASDEYRPTEPPFGYGAYGVAGDTNWTHGTGRVCFDRTIDTNLIQPFPKQIPQSKR